MRHLFPGHYRPTAEEFDRLWREGEVVLDTNVLLNLYRYGERARRSWLDVLARLSDRIWIPYQVATEFQSNRVSVIVDQRRRYDDVRKLADGIRSQTESVLNGLSRHPTLDTKQLEGFIYEGLEKLIAHVDSVEQGHTEFTQTEELVATDPIRTELDKILEGRVGVQDPDDVAERRQKEAIERLEGQVPPGFRDVAKKDNIEAATGDVLLWLQLVEHSTDVQKPVILITDERGEDWWWKSKGRTLGPRPELVAEMRSRADILFCLYSPDEFLRRSIERFGVHVEDLDAAADETREVSDWVRSHRDSQMAAKIADRITWIQRQIDEEDEHQARLISELQAVGSEISSYSELPPKYENGPIGEKAERRKWAAERRRDKTQRQLDELHSRRETLRRELASMESELRTLRSSVGMRSELDRYREMGPRPANLD